MEKSNFNQYILFLLIKFNNFYALRYLSKFPPLNFKYFLFISEFLFYL